MAHVGDLHETGVREERDQLALPRDRRDVVIDGRHEKGRWRDRGGELGDVVRDGGAEGLEQHVARGETREVAIVLGVDPAAQSAVARLRHRHAHDARHDPAAEHREPQSARQGGARAVEGDREPREHTPRAGEGRCADRVHEHEVGRRGAARDRGARDDRAERVTEDDRVTAHTEFAQERIEPGRVGGNVVRSTLQRRRLPEPG